jgi:hypothetical protein
MTRRGCFRFFPLPPLLSLLFVLSCAPVRPAEDLPALERQWPARARVFRHKVNVDFPGKNAGLSFDGIVHVRAGAGRPAIRAVCLGALGLTLCDMTVTPEGYRVDYLHPALGKVPNIADHIALCVGSVWFASLPVAGRGEKDAVLRERYGNTLLEHFSEKDSRRVVRARGPEAFWTLAYAPAEPQPPLVTFSSDGYTVRIRFVAEQDEGGQRP